MTVDLRILIVLRGQAKSAWHQDKIRQQEIDRPLMKIAYLKGV